MALGTRGKSKSAARDRRHARLRKKIEGRLQAKHPDQWLPLYSQVKFTDTPYVDALREGQRHDRIMEQVLAMPGVEERWETEEVERKVLDLLGSNS